MPTPPASVDDLGKDPAAGDILRRLVGNSFWTFNSSIFIRVVNLVRGVILARLLTPDDLGLSSIATVIVGVTLVVSDVGASNFLFYRPKEASEHADAAFWVNAIMVTVFAAVLGVAAPWISSYYGRPDLVPILQVSMVTFWCQGMSTVHRSLLRADLKIRRLSMIDAGAGLAAFGVGVGLACAGFRAWALVFSLLVNAVLTLVLQAAASGWRPRFRLPGDSLRALFSFSGWYVGSSFVLALYQSLDSFLIGKWLGLEALGVYGLAMLYAMMPFPLIASSLGQAAFPELVRLHHDPARFWETFHRVSRLLIFGVAPLAATGIAAAPDLFPLVFGTKWAGAIVPFQILTAFVMIRCLWIDPVASVGRFRGSFLLNVATVVVAFLAVWIAIPSGVAGVAAAVLIVGAAWQVAALLVTSGSLRRVMTGLGVALPFVAGSAFMLGVSWAVRHLLAEITEGRPWIRVAVVIPVVLGGYALLFRRQVREVFSLLLKPSDPLRTPA